MPLQVNRLTGLGVVSGGIPPATGVEFLATMTGNSAPSPQVATASSELSGYEAFKAFDKANVGLSNLFSTNSVASAWVAIDTGGNPVLWSYSVQNRGDGSELTGSPRDWTLEGSDNGSSWTVVDTRTSQTSWTAGQVRSYTLSVGVRFRHYRLNVSANNGSAFLQIGELRLFS